MKTILFNNYKLYINSTHFRLVDKDKNVYDGVVDYKTMPYLGTNNKISLLCNNLSEYGESINILFDKYIDTLKIKYIDESNWRQTDDPYLYNNEVFIYFDKFNYSIKLNKIHNINHLMNIDLNNN
jgi:hypothetical protein